MARPRSARQIAAAKRNLAKARRKKARFHVRNRKKLASRRYKRKGIVEYVDHRGVRSGQATNTSSRTVRQAFRKLRKASRHNKRYWKQLRKHRRKVAKATAKAKRR